MNLSTVKSLFSLTIFCRFFTYNNFAGILGAAIGLVGDLHPVDLEAVLEVDGKNLALLCYLTVSVTHVLLRVCDVS